MLNFWALKPRFHRLYAHRRADTMGIKGLWGEVKPVCRDAHLEEFRGSRVGVDMYVWLHRAVSGSVDLSTEANVEMLRAHVESLSDPSVTVSAHPIPLNTKFLHWVMSQVELLLRYGVKPVLVFDGRELPMKREEEEERRRNRIKHLSEALDLLRRNSRPTPSERKDIAGLVERGMDITTELAHAVIMMLQERQLECIVAPYEADAQLAYLCQQRYVDAVITEDSDLLVYWCPRLIAKLDHKGSCQVIEVESVLHCPLFQGLSYNSFLVGCILSGCDYLPNLRHIGVKKAFGIMSEARSVPDVIRLLEENYGFPREQLRKYEAGLQRAIYCFLHHIVFDPVKRALVTRTPLPNGVAFKQSILGELVGDDLAQSMCCQCLYDPTTRSLYKGIYQYCLDNYRKTSRAGQSTLTAFNGFKELRSPRMTLRLASSNSQASATSVSNTPLTPPTKTFFSAPLEKVREAEGYCGPKVVRSKYFVNGQWKVDNWEESSSQGGDSNTKNGNSDDSQSPSGAVTDECDAAGGVRSDGGKCCVKSEPPTPPDRVSCATLSCKASSVCQVAGASDSATADADRAVDPSHGEFRGTELTCSDVCGLTEVPCSNVEGSASALLQECGADAPNDPVGADRASVQDVNESAEMLCPLGYIQCRQKHSLFEQCFVGKGWTKKANNPNDQNNGSGAQVVPQGDTDGDGGTSPWRTRGSAKRRWSEIESVQPSQSPPLVSSSSSFLHSIASTTASPLTVREANDAKTGGSCGGSVSVPCRMQSNSPKTLTEQCANGLATEDASDEGVNADFSASTSQSSVAAAPKAAALFELLSYTRR